MPGNHYPQLFRYTAGPEDRGCTLEEVLRRAGLSGRRIRHLVRERKIRVNGRPSFLAKPMKPGDRVEVDLRETVSRAGMKLSDAPEGGRRDPAGTPQPQVSAPPVPILYEDEWLLVVNKPGGMTVHTSPAPRSANPRTAPALADHLRQWGAKASPPWIPHVVHRLDRDTAGALLVAKSAHIHARLDTALRQGRIHRTYVALVEGDARDLPERIDFPLAPDPRRPGRFVPAAGLETSPALDHPRPGGGKVGGGTPTDAKPARTRVLKTTLLPAGEPVAAVTSAPPISQFPSRVGPQAVTLVEMELETGRTHQIRVHLAAFGHPILGDRWYHSHYPGLALMLFARRLVFPHPSDGRGIEVLAPFPEPWRPWLASIPGEQD